MATIVGNPFSQSQPYAQSGWIKTGSVGLNNNRWQLTNPHNERVAFIGSRDGQNDAIAKDLTDITALGIPISDTDWRLRCILSWPTNNSFRNTDVAFAPGNNNDLLLSDSDNTVNPISNQKFVGIRISNSMSSPATLRAGGTPIPPNGFRGLMSGLTKDVASFTSTGVFTPGGQPGALSNSHIQLERIGTLGIMTLFTGPSFTVPIEQRMMAIPATIVGLKYIKVTNLAFDNSGGNALIAGFLTQYSLLSGSSFTPIMPIFNNGLAAKIYNDIGTNGPSTGNEVFDRIFDDGNFPETWVRIREKHMYGFLEEMGLIQKDVDEIEWDISTWSVT